MFPLLNSYPPLPVTLLLPLDSASFKCSRGHAWDQGCAFNVTPEGHSPAYLPRSGASQAAPPHAGARAKVPQAQTTFLMNYNMVQKLSRMI